MKDLEQLASRQLRDYDQRNPGAMFANGVQLSVDDAYKVQNAVAEMRQDRGEQRIGFKVGCTSPVIRSQLGIDHPVVGHLWDLERSDSGCELKLSDYYQAAIEGELAIQLADGLSDDNLDDAGIASAIGDVFPVVELHNAAFRSGQSSAAELIANNALHAGFVAGEVRTPFRRLEAAKLTIELNGETVDGYEGAELTNGVIRSLRWLAGHLSRFDRSLHAGDVVLTGSLPKLIPLTGEAEVLVETSHFDTVKASFVN